MGVFSLSRLRGQPVAGDSLAAESASQAGPPPTIEPSTVEVPVAKAQARPAKGQKAVLAVKFLITRLIWPFLRYGVSAASFAPLFVGLFAFKQQRYGTYGTSVGAIDLSVASVGMLLGVWIAWITYWDRERYSLVIRRITFVAGLMLVPLCVVGVATSGFWFAQVGCTGSNIDPAGTVRVHFKHRPDQLRTLCGDMTTGMKQSIVVLGIMGVWWAALMALFYTQMCRTKAVLPTEGATSKEAYQSSDVESNIS